METKEALQAQITELRLANERLAHLPEKFDKFAETMMAELRTVRTQPASFPQQQQQAPPDHMALALHRLADLFEKQNPRGQPLVTALAVVGIGAIVIGAVLMALKFMV